MSQKKNNIEKRIDSKNLRKSNQKIIQEKNIHFAQNREQLYK